MRYFYLSLFLLPGLAVAADAGFMKPGPLPALGGPGPAHHSHVFVGQATILNGSASLDVPLDAPGNATLVVFDTQPVTARAPEGRELRNVPFRNPVLESMDVPAVGARVDVASLGRGTHNVKLETARRSGALKYAVVQPESAVDLVLQVSPLAARSGEPVTVTAMLDDASPAQTDVTAKVRGVGKIALHDDGSDGDVAANDGIYTARFTAPHGKGLQETAIRVDVDGHLVDGTRFRRTATAVAMVSHSTFRLDADDVVVTADALRIPVTDAKGSYRIEAIYGVDGQAIAWARDEWSSTKRRGSIVELPRPAIAMAADQVVIRVLDTETLALAAEFALALQPQASSVPVTHAGAPEMPRQKAQAALRHGQAAR